MGGMAPQPCTLAMAGDPVAPWSDQASLSRPNVTIRSRPEGAELLLQFWRPGAHVLASIDMTETGWGPPNLPPTVLDNGTRGAGTVAPTSTPGSTAALFSVFSPPQQPPHRLALQRQSFDGTAGPVSPLSIDVGHAAMGGHVARIEGAAPANHVITYHHFAATGVGPHLEPRVALVDAQGELTHGPISLLAPTDEATFGRQSSSTWIDDHALTVVAQPACSPNTCPSPNVSVHRITPGPAGQLDHAAVWRADTTDLPSAQLATDGGRVWLAVFDGTQPASELMVWELAADGTVVAGPVTVETGLSSGTDTTPPLAVTPSTVDLVATPWGLVVATRKLTDQPPPSGALVVAELSFVHLSLDLDVLTPPIVIPIVDPSQQSPIRAVATPHDQGVVVVWSSRGLPADAPFGPNDGGNVYLTHLVCRD